MQASGWAGGRGRDGNGERDGNTHRGYVRLPPRWGLLFSRGGVGRSAGSARREYCIYIYTCTVTISLHRSTTELTLCILYSIWNNIHPLKYITLLRSINPKYSNQIAIQRENYLSRNRSIHTRSTKILTHGRHLRQLVSGSISGSGRQGVKSSGVGSLN